MATYLVLIHGDEGKWEAMTPDELEQLMQGHRNLAERAGSAIIDTRELEPASGARTLRADGAGGVAIMDGPFQETTEVVGGFYLIEAAGLDEVTDLVSGLYEVTAGHSGVEIRPVAGRD